MCDKRSSGQVKFAGGGSADEGLDFSFVHAKRLSA